MKDRLNKKPIEYPNSACSHFSTFASTVLNEIRNVKKAIILPDQK